MAGLVISIARRDFLLPTWLVAMFVFDPRSASTFAMIPLAMLIGVATVVAVETLLPRERMAANSQVSPRGAWLAAAVLPLLIWGSASAVVTSSVDSSPLHALSEENRQAISWVTRETPEDSRFLVIKGPSSPWTDSLSEWFPALAKRSSLGTVQGYEWLGKGRYERQQDRYDELQACVGDSFHCLENWASHVSPSFTHVYVLKPKADDQGDCCSSLKRSLRASSRYVVIYDGPGATIFERKAIPGD